MQLVAAVQVMVQENGLCRVNGVAVKDVLNTVVEFCVMFAAPGTA